MYFISMFNSTEKLQESGGMFDQNVVYICENFIISTENPQV